MSFVHISKISSSFNNLADGIRKITGKWSDKSDLKIPDLKVLSIKVFVKILSIAVTIFLLDFFMVRIIPF